MLDDEFLMYCSINNISDVEKLARETFNRGFTLLKYGETPIKILEPEPKIVEKVVEKIKEVPVEKVVEIIRESPKEKHFEKVIIEKYKDSPQSPNIKLPRVPRERGNDHLYDE